MTGPVHVVLPASVDDRSRPSGGNVYDNRLCDELGAVGWSVLRRPVAGAWPTPDRAAVAALDAVLDAVPDGEPVLVDALVASAAPEVVGRHLRRLHVVVLVHLPLGTGDRARRDGEARMLRAVAAVVTTSTWTRTWLLEEYAVAPSRTTVAVPGADPAALATGTSSGGSFVCVGAVTRLKGHDLLVEALLKLDAGSWECTCVGSLDVDPGFANGLRERAPSGVRFTGPLLGADLHAAYRAADVLVLPSRTETYGMVATEALAHGLPVIAAETGGVPEALGLSSDGRPPGLLVPPEDAGALAHALRTWLEDPALRACARRDAEDRRTTLPSWRETAARVAAALAG